LSIEIFELNAELVELVLYSVGILFLPKLGELLFGLSSSAGGVGERGFVFLAVVEEFGFVGGFRMNRRGR
jgi:hypothetical protein